MIRRRAALSPPDRLIAACIAALLRLEAAIAKPNETPGEPPNTFVETGEVLFWLYAVGDTETEQFLAPGFQWARHQYAHGNLLTEAVEFHYGDATPSDEPPVHLWSPLAYIGTHRKSRDHRPLSPKAEAVRRAQWTGYEDNLARHPVVPSLWDELSRLTAIVSPRDLAPNESVLTGEFDKR